MSPKAHVCSWIEEDNTKMLPRGWRDGLTKLHRIADCDGSASAQAALRSAGGLKLSREEKYLAGLEAPGYFYRVDMQKQEGEKVGFGIIPRTDYLEVEKISGGGALQRWNSAHPQRLVKIKDRIIVINGLEGNGTLMADELRSAVNVSLRIFRLGEADAKAMEAKATNKEILKVIKTKPPSGLGVGIPEPQGSQVVVLHANNLDKFIEMQPVTLVMFYANWCGHCQQVAPGFTQASMLLAKEKLPLSARIAKFDDGDEANRIARAGAEDRYNFSSYPTMVIFKGGKKEFYVNNDDAEEIVTTVRATAEGKDLDNAMRELMLKLKPQMYKQDTPSDVVYDFTPDDFDDVVLKDYQDNNRVWIIEFYSDKCPFCKSLKPEVIQASKELKKKFNGEVRIGAVNSRAFDQIQHRFGVSSYPWIISVYAGKKISDMAGLGGSDSIVNWGALNHREVWKAKPKWSYEPILVPAEATEDNQQRGKKEIGMFSNSTGSWRELLGRRTWFFLHTLAAKYPEEPTEKDKEGIRHIVSGLGQHYPCPICRAHLQKKLVDPALGPVAVENRQDIALWFCRLHNMVNLDLGKPEQPCNAFQLDLQYLKSCGECSANQNSTEKDEIEASTWDVSRYYTSLAAAPAKEDTGLEASM